MKIFVVLRGGLGNQLFQTLAGDFFSRKYSASVTLDDFALFQHSDPTRRTWIKKLDVNRIFENDNIRILNQKNRIVRKIRKSGFQVSSALSERDILNLGEPSKRIILFDWFQNTNYIPEKRRELRTEYVKNLRLHVRKYGETVFDSTTIGAIHIRLGDFKSTSWGILPAATYQKAVLKLMEVGIKTIDCYSDDINSAAKILEPMNKIANIRYPEIETTLAPHELLWTLTQYQSYSSSNSSLSWWASYFNQHEKPNIFSPWDKKLHLTQWKKV